MDAVRVDYGGRIKEASDSDRLAAAISKAPTISKYVFRPEVVKAAPKYSYHAVIDGRDRDLLNKEQRRPSNGLRGLFGRRSKQSSDSQSLDRDSVDRRRSRSLFLAHDHSKEHSGPSETRADHFGPPKARNSAEDRRPWHDPKSRKDPIDVRLKTGLDHDRNSVPRHRSPGETTSDKRRDSSEHLETCQEEYRKNGKLCQPHDDRYCQPGSRKSQQDLSLVRDGDRLQHHHHHHHHHQNHHQEEIVSRDWSSPRHRSKCGSGTDQSQLQPQPQPQVSRTAAPRSPEEPSRLLRRVDSPYPCANHVVHLSPGRDADVADVRGGKLSYSKTVQDEFGRPGTGSEAFDASEVVCGTHQECKNCGAPHSPSSEYRGDFATADRVDATDRIDTTDRIGGVEERKFVLDRTRKSEDTGSPAVAALLYRSRSLPQLSVHDSGVASGNEHNPGRPTSRLVADLRQLLTLKQHYYPEGGWGWVIVVVGVLVQILSHGMHGASGALLQHVEIRFGTQVYLQSGWLGAMSTGVALLVSPVTIAFCRKKSTRVTAVLGGLVTALGCLFTSFASQFHQLFFSYGTVVGIGVGMTRDCSTLMVAQYFKRRREFVEIFIVSGSGLGIAVMSAFIKGAISKIGWRLGLQAVTGVVFLTFILGTFYRSASLYHPQRRAILHLKNQKRKIKDKNKADDRPPFFDFSTLKSKTVRILLVSTGISAFGINTPIFYLAHQAEEEGLGDTVILLQAYLGLAWTLGCVAFGLLVVHHSVECRIARQYLTQAAVFMCGLCILALTAVHGNYHGYVMFTWIYGIFCGGYHYSLKMYTYERVRARNFARTWGFVQCSQAIPIAIGVPISGYINVGCGGKAGYYFSSTCVLVGSFTLFFIDLHRRNLSRHKHTRANGTRHLCVSDNCPQRRRLSFTQEPENEGVAAGAAAAALVLGAELAPGPGEIIDALGTEKPELTCISEEGIADMDLPDNLLDDLDYIGDCITSCNKVENYLMLSEFENNLIAEMPIIMDRKGRRWSLARSKQGGQGSQTGDGNGNGNGNGNNGNGNGNGNSQAPVEDEEIKQKWRLAPAPPNNRVITVIDEAST